MKPLHPVLCCELCGEVRLFGNRIKLAAEIDASIRTANLYRQHAVISRGAVEFQPVASTVAGGTPAISASMASVFHRR